MQHALPSQINLNVFYQEACKRYQSPSQRSRYTTENWFRGFSYCPACTHTGLETFPANKPVADFFCPDCGEEYELKSKKGAFGKKVRDGAYVKMKERICSSKAPNLLLLNYNEDYWVTNLIILPKFLFTLDIIEEATPLSPNARRSGWQGCNILFGKLPNALFIYLIKSSSVAPINHVHKLWEKYNFLEQEKDMESRGWLIDVMECVERIPSREFALSDIYQFSEELQKKHPENNNIHAKIRQQLQVLRDQDVINFLGGGRYEKK